MSESGREPTCTFNAVSTIGAGYLAATWVFFKLMFSLNDRLLVGIFGTLGFIIEGMFLLVFLAQRKERFALLRVPPAKTRWLHDGDDVVLRMLNGLLVAALFSLLVFGLFAVLSGSTHFKTHPVSF